MNLNTFKDNISSKRGAFDNDVQNLRDADDDDDDDDRPIETFQGSVEGEDTSSNAVFDDGQEFEPFNLKSDREMGYFDKNMNFVFKKDRGEVDTWLAGLDEASMEKSIGEAAKAHKMKMEHEKNRKDYDDQNSNKLCLDLIVELLQYMKENETVRATLKRFSGGKVAMSNARRGAKDSKESVVQGDKTSFDRCTDVANYLLSMGFSNIYDMTYEVLHNWSVLWEYQAADGSIQGPYPTMSILTWKSQGYFTGESAVVMRSIGLPGSLGIWRKAQQQTASKESGNKRKADSQAHSPMKKAKRDYVEDLENDFSSDDENNNNDGKKECTDDNDTSESSNPQNDISAMPRGQWVMSDDINFGDPNDVMLLEKLDQKGTLESQRRPIDRNLNLLDDDDDSDSDDSNEVLLARRRQGAAAAASAQSDDEDDE